MSNATVVFMPQGRGENNEAGYGSQGETDADGRYQLTTVEKSPKEGAVLGSHRVMITTRRTSLDPNDDERVVEDHPETIPHPFCNFRSSPLRVTVTEGGTESEDFELSSQKKRKRK